MGETNHLKDLQLSLEVDLRLIEYRGKDVNRYLELIGKHVVNYNLFKILISSSSSSIIL